MGLMGTAAGFAGDFAVLEEEFDCALDAAAFDPAGLIGPVLAPASPDSTTGLAVVVFAGASLIAGDLG